MTSWWLRIDTQKTLLISHFDTATTHRQQQKDNVKSILLLLWGREREKSSLIYQFPLWNRLRLSTSTRNQIFTDDATTLINKINNFFDFHWCTIFSIECKLCSKHILHEIAIILTVSTRSMLYWNIYLLQRKWAAVKDERIYDTSNEMTTTMDSDNLTILWPLKCHRRRLFRNWFFSHFINVAVFSSSSFCSS